jgi:outer membrane receptor protein involved in Fe transport
MAFSNSDRGGPDMTRLRSRQRLGVAMMLVVGAVFVFGPALAATTGGLRGTVRDAATGEPIGLATVTIPELKRGATTDAQGNYFVINLPPGRYTVRVALLGFIPQVREGVEISADFNTTVDFSVQSTVLQDVAAVEVRGERPLIQPDVTTTTKFIGGEEIQNQPLRGYQDAVAQQSGVVNFKQNIDNEANNNNTLIIRGGRPNEVAYYVDGFSQQDPLTGVSTTSINTDAISEVVVQAGGFNAEYGRINSGVINVITREGSERYFGSLEAVTDNLAGDWINTPQYDNNIYAAAVGGPLTPSITNVTFYLSGERRFNRDRSPSAVTDEIFHASQPDLFEDGVLPVNSTALWSGMGKLAWKPSPLQTLRLGGTVNTENWQQYLNAYRFNLDHAPRYEDKNWSVYTNWNHSLSDRAYYELKANIFTTERTRGDGVHFDDLEGYSRPEGNATFDPNEAIFWYGDDGPTGAHVFDDYLKRKSTYTGFAANYANQMSKSFQLKAGGDYQRHTLRYYNHYFPTQLHVPLNSTYDAGEPYTDTNQNGIHDAGEPFTDTNIANFRDADRYGYDALGNEIDGGDTFTDANGNGAYDLTEPFQDTNGNGVFDDPLDEPKHPQVASLYVQGKYEQLGLVVNAGLRWDYLTPATEALRSDTRPLDPDGVNDSRLQEGDLEDSKVYNRLSPRLGVGFPVSEQTLVHVNYGKFFQQPNLQDLYVSYAFLEHKIRTGGYFVGFGNPNLLPEETTAYELGLQHTPSDRSRIQATAYYKDVKNLVEITNIPSTPNSFSSYRNRDFATIKGLDMSYTMRRTGNIAVNANYSLSWANGTGSVSQSQRNIAWTADETPKQTSPLAYDQRHKFSFNFDYRYGKGEGPLWGGTRFLEDAGINILFNAASGTPYTPARTFNEITLAAVASEPTGPLNSRYGPWSWTVDAKVSKSLTVARQNLDLYLWVLNIFDRENVIDVYSSSGSSRTTNFLNTPQGEAYLATNADTYGEEEAANRYRLGELDPNLFGIPRMVRFGAKLSF